MLYFKVPHKGTNKVAGRAGVSLKGKTGQDQLPSSRNWWVEFRSSLPTAPEFLPSGSDHVSFTKMAALLESMQIEKAAELISKMEMTVLHNIILGSDISSSLPYSVRSKS